MEREKGDLARAVSNQRKALEALAEVAHHFELTAPDKQLLDELMAKMERQLSDNRKLMIRNTTEARAARQNAVPAAKKKSRAGKQHGRKFCTQCQDFLSSGDLTKHFKRVHGRPPTPGEKNQSRKHRKNSGTTYDGNRPPRGPTVQGGSPGLGKRS